MESQKFRGKLLFREKKQLDTTGMITDIGIHPGRFPANLAGLVHHSAVPVIATGDRDRRTLPRNNPTSHKREQRGNKQYTRHSHHRNGIYHSFFFPAINSMLNGLRRQEKSP